MDVQSYVLISLSLHTHTPLVITKYLLEAAVRTESDAKLQISVDFGAGFGRKILDFVSFSAIDAKNGFAIYFIPTNCKLNGRKVETKNL